MKQPEGLYLKIEREIERECEGCYGCKPDKVIQVNATTAGGTRLNFCQGTGRVKRRLRGWVEARTSSRGLVWNEHLGGRANDCNRYDLADKLTAAYLAGELPQKIAENLEETEVDPE